MQAEITLKRLFQTNFGRVILKPQETTTPPNAGGREQEDTMAIITTFERTEKKYLLEPGQFDALSRMLSDRMTIDQYGRHTICNIYYDTDDYRLIRASIEKPSYKEKLRLRGYGIPRNSDPVFVELKKKCGGVVYKRRERLTLDEARRFLGQSAEPVHQNQILREIGWFLNLYQPSPKVFLAYDRIALYGSEDPGLRITFDDSIRWRTTALDLAMGDWGSPLLPGGCRLMEIKLCGGMPLWLARALSECKAYPTSFSKYGEVYRVNLARTFLKKGDCPCA